MKNCIKRLILLILTALMLFDITTQNINIDRELAKKGKKKKPDLQPEEQKPETPLEKLINELTQFFDVKLKSFKPQKTDDGEGNLTYDIPEKHAKVTMQVEGTKLEVVLTNDYENQSIELQNVEFEDQRELIESEYVDKFVNGLSQIETNIKSIWAAIQEGFKVATYTGSFGLTQFDKITVKGKPKIDSLEFTMSYLNPGIVMPGEPISGMLNRDNDSFILTIVTKFFQKSFELGILTDGYLQTEARRMGIKTLSHLDSMYYINENPSDEGIERNFLFNDYVTEMKDTLENYLGPDFTVEVNESGAIVNLGEDPVATISITEEVAGNFVCNVLKCKIEVLNNEEYSLVIPSSSIFGMEALADKFLIEIMDNLKHAVNKVDEGEQVKIFE